MNLLGVDPAIWSWGREEVRYYGSGEGSPVILLHGLGGSAQVWHRNFSALSEQYTVFAIDLWGPGRNQGRLSVQVGLELLGEFVRDHCSSPVHIVGSSLGGLLAARFAAQEQHSVASLTLVGSAGFGRRIGFQQRLFTLPIVGEIVFTPRRTSLVAMMKNVLHDPTAASDELIEVLLAERRAGDIPRQMLGALRAGVGLTGVKRSALVLSQAKDINAPTLVLWGSRDQLFSPAQGIQASHLLNAELVLFEEAGHWCFLEQPDIFNATLKMFLARSAGGWSG